MKVRELKKILDDIGDQYLDCEVRIDVPSINWWLDAEYAHLECLVGKDIFTISAYEEEVE